MKKLIVLLIVLLVIGLSGPVFGVTLESGLNVRGGKVTSTNFTGNAIGLTNFGNVTAQSIRTTNATVVNHFYVQDPNSAAETTFTQDGADLTVTSDGTFNFQLDLIANTFRGDGSGLTNMPVYQSPSDTLSNITSKVAVNASGSITAPSIRATNSTFVSHLYVQDNASANETAFSQAGADMTVTGDGSFIFQVQPVFGVAPVGDGSSLTNGAGNAFLDKNATNNLNTALVARITASTNVSFVRGIVQTGATTNGGVVTLPDPAAGSQTPWSSDINANAKSLTNAQTIQATTLSVDAENVTTMNVTNIVANVREAINVRTYGAATNATADANSAAFKLAIEAATNNVTFYGYGGAVYVPPGQYQLASNIVAYPTIFLKGNGRDVTTLSFPDGISNCITFLTNGFNASYDILAIGVEDLTIRTPRSTPCTGDAISMDATMGEFYFSPVVRNVNIKVQGRYGIYMRRIIGGIVENVNEAYATQDGIFVAGGPIVISGGYFHQNSGYGIHLSGGGANSVIGAAADSNSRGGVCIDGHAVNATLTSVQTEQNSGSQFWLGDSVNTTLSGCSAYQGTSATSTNGITIDGATGLSIDNLYAGANGSATASGWAVYVTATSTEAPSIRHANLDSFGLGTVSDITRFPEYADRYNGVYRFAGPDASVTLSNGTISGTFYATNLVGRGYHGRNLATATSTGCLLDAQYEHLYFFTNNTISLQAIQNLKSGQPWNGTLCVSNYGGSTIYVTNLPFARLIGAVSTNVLALPSGKQGYWSFESSLDGPTNSCNVAEQ